jgi:hypothetical protein
MVSMATILPSLNFNSTQAVSRLNSQDNNRFTAKISLQISIFKNFQSVVMNPFPKCCLPSTAPIPHQFAMKPYVDTWIYITKKCGNMRFIEVYEGILNYIMTQNPTIPSFIAFYVSFVFKALSILIIVPYDRSILNSEVGLTRAGFFGWGWMLPCFSDRDRYNERGKNGRRRFRKWEKASAS